MTIQPAIEIKNVSKVFKIFKDRPLTLKEKLLNLRSDAYTPFYALKNVSFAINKGESIGLIGHNGCGKSTLLSIIARILYPTGGTVKVNGRLSCLIELGAGFHPDFTGRENIYMNAAIFGMTKKEINKNIDAIIDFSELKEFIDNPVRTYSSGMYLKLAFSVAIHVDPEILLIDEILAVGDSNFQKKCFDKMKEFRRKRVTIVLVTHSLSSITEFCDRCLWLQDGVIRKEGSPKDVTDEYLQFMTGIQNAPKNQPSGYAQDAEIKDFSLQNKQGQRIETGLNANDNLTAEVSVLKKERSGPLKISLKFLSADNALLGETNTEKINFENQELKKIIFNVTNIPLNSGSYQVLACVDNENNQESCPAKELCLKINSERTNPGLVSLKYDWTTENL